MVWLYIKQFLKTVIPLRGLTVRRMKFLLHWEGLLMRKIMPKNWTGFHCSRRTLRLEPFFNFGNIILHKESCQTPSWITEQGGTREQGLSNHALGQIKWNSEKRLAISQIVSTLMRSPLHLTNYDHFTNPNSKNNNNNKSLQVYFVLENMHQSIILWRTKLIWKWLVNLCSLFVAKLRSYFCSYFKIRDFQTLLHNSGSISERRMINTKKRWRDFFIARALD